MENQFNPHRGPYRGDDTTTHRNRETLDAQGSNHFDPTSPILSDFQQLLGESFEPDPLFFIETWTLGTPAAVENFRMRQPMQTDRSMKSDCSTQVRNDSSPGYISTQSFFHANPFNWTVFVSVNTIVQENCTATSAQHSPAEPHPSDADNSIHQDEDLPVDLQHAHRILGVTATSSLSQIKTAHRQLVIAWHPDRLQHKSEEIRRCATQKLTIINEAYRLLRNNLLQRPA